MEISITSADLKDMCKYMDDLKVKSLDEVGCDHIDCSEILFSGDGGKLKIRVKYGFDIEKDYKRMSTKSMRDKEERRLKYLKIKE